MKILGALGIDSRILLIQALNFLLLFLLLKWLFFKPFIRALREEKSKVQELKDAQAALEEEKAKFQKQREKEISQAKAKVEAILSEADRIARQIKEKSRERAAEMERRSIERVRRMSQDILDEYKEELAKDYKQRAIAAILGLFNSSLPRKVKEEIQRGFWLAFLKKLRGLDISKTLRIKRELSRFPERSLSPSRKSKSKTKKATFVINCAFPLTRAQRQDLKSYLRTQLKQRLVLEEKTVPDLIAGFALEIDGILIEENLRARLENIFRY